MKRIALLLTLLIMLPGCASRPIQTIMRGAMRMTGDMTMNGKMDMTGKVTTVVQTDNTASRLVSVPVYAGPGATHTSKVAVIDVDGLLVNQNLAGFGSMGENPVALFREKLDLVAHDPTIGAVVLRINSPGGGVTAADVMLRDLERLKRQRGIPVIACLMDVGAGAGYYLATGADRVIAHPTSLVGGIGVILNIYNLDTAMGQFLVMSIPVKSGDKIDMASPLRDLEPAEREILQEIGDQFHERFIEQVQSRVPVAISNDILDGRIMTGQQAAAQGLVDATGYLDDAVAAARELAQLSPDAPSVMLRRDNDRAHTLLDVTPNTPTTNSIIPLNIPGFDRSKLPTFLYLWQPDPSFITASGG